MRIVSIGSLVVMLAGCGSCDPFDPFDPGPSPDEDAGSFNVACLSGLDVPDAATIANADSMLAPFADGTLDVPLSPMGCWRMVRTVEGGALVSATITLNAGPQFDSMTGRFVGEAMFVLARAERQADGTQLTRVDADPDPDDVADDFLEWEQRIEPARGRIERVLRSPASRDVIDRQVIERQSDGSYVQTDEELRDGVLVQVASFTVGPPNEQQGSGGDCVERDCTTEEITRIEQAAQQALTRSFMCHQGSGPGDPRFRKLVELMLRWGTGHTYRCSTGCGIAGRFCADCQAGGGPLEITVNPTLTDSELVSTLGHELGHGYAGLHDTRVLSLIDQSLNGEATADEPEHIVRERAERMLQATDPMYACEQYCFGGRVDRCTCARCLGVRACDPPCASLPECRVYDPVVMKWLSSEAVGAACDPLLGDATWHPDLASCETACQVAGVPIGTCQSFSLSCDPTCK